MFSQNLFKSFKNQKRFSGKTEKQNKKIVLDPRALYSFKTSAKTVPPPSVVKNRTQFVWLFTLHVGDSS